MTLEMYLILMSKTEKIKSKYLAVRLRIALTLLFITGVIISELLTLRVCQIKNLLTNGWISIDRSKRGHASHKACLTPQGFKIIKSRKKDFEILMYFKTENSYIFTVQYSDKYLERGSSNRLINEFIKQVIGHANIDTNSLYVENLSDEERQKRMQNISTPQDLIIIYSF